jgi:outer membrane receptor protein involved in Fe transport
MSKRSFLLILTIMSMFIFLLGDAFFLCAQETSSSEFTLEEITVTAEKRSVNLQTVASSVTAIEASELAEMGKVTAAQMLESVPNVTISSYGRGGGGTLSDNISIRGVRKTQEPGGAGNPVPSATATYVDDVYEGIGGDYDLNRIEVLRGPQGTLYGRSATGGVVALHTNDPRLGKFSADVSAEDGKESRINLEGAVNAPIGDKVALRAAVHYFHQAEGYYNGKGGENETKAGRIKALFQPTEKLSLLLSLSASREQSWAGGFAQSLSAPNTIDYKNPVAYTAPNKGVPTKRNQESLHVNYDLGDSALTYIAAIHSTDNRGKSGVGLNRSSYQYNVTTGKPSEIQTHEIRWASATESALTWLIGGNYYKNTYESISTAFQASDINSTDPASYNAELFAWYLKGSIANYGLFTEETYKVRDDMRITAGLRYDKTKIKNYTGFDFNKNLGPFMVGFKPENIIHFPTDATYFLDSPDFDNITYKLRLEYDITPENMLYALTATGFLPGDSQVSVATKFSPPPDMTLVDVGFIKLPYKQQLLTSYEIGTKNRFLDKKLQLNGSIFYYDYGGYQEAININPPGSPPPPNFIVLRVPVRMIGFEVDCTWLLTQNDKLTLSGGYLDAELKSYPDIPTSTGGTESGKTFMYLKRVPGLPKSSGTLGYDHTFLFGDGSTLVPRAQARYTSGYYLGQITAGEAASTDTAGNSYLGYLYQDSIVLGDISATWTSPESKYSATAYVRNVTDKRYKTSATLPTGSPLTNVTVGDPRTWGLMIKAKF